MTRTLLGQPVSGQVVLVCGGRHFAHGYLLKRRLTAIHKRSPIGLIVHGGAIGADSYAHDWARQHGIPALVVFADWARHGSAAGPLRNGEMALLQPDLCVVCPGGAGTANMRMLAQRHGIPVEAL